MWYILYKYGNILHLVDFPYDHELSSKEINVETGDGEKLKLEVAPMTYKVFDVCPTLLLLGICSLNILLAHYIAVKISYR
jgi:hypothetical protein